MFDPSWDEGCPSCTAGADENAEGLRRHLEARDTTFAAVSRAPLAKLERYKATRGWTFPWYSSYGSEFNYDFHVSLDPARGPVEFNYRGGAELEAMGAGWLLEGPTEQPGFSAFLTDGGEVFHTYSTFARGTEWTGGSYAFLDLTALGRQEDVGGAQGADRSRPGQRAGLRLLEVPEAGTTVPAAAQPRRSGCGPGRPAGGATPDPGARSSRHDHQPVL